MSSSNFAPNAQAIIWHNDHLLLLGEQLPTASLVQALAPLHLAGQWQQKNIFSGELDPQDSEGLIPDAPEGMTWITLRQALSQMPQDLLPLLVRTRQLNIFERGHRFCSACAHLLENNARDTGKTCPACGALYFPKLSPAMMVVVMRGKELLLARAPHFTNNMYSALAGFVESGETLEACVHREVMEEVGVRITNLRYMGSQSWPFPHSLMLAFLADYVDGDIVPQEGEIADAQWFSAEALPNIPGTHSIAYRLIQQAVAHTRQQDVMMS